MIPRYSLSPMKDLWTEDAKYQRWLEVELAVADAQAELGDIPKEAARIIKQKVKVDIARAQEIEAAIGHDLLAFVRSLEEQVGPEGRYLHKGLTSYDVEDTALSFAMSQAFGLLIAKLEELLKVLKRRALEHKGTLMVGRTHGMHAEPITFGLKLLLWYDEFSRYLQRLQEAQAVVSIGKISGSVGTYAHVDPRIEERVCAKLDLHPARIANQSLQRDRHAQALATLAMLGATLEKMATEIRNLHRTEIGEVREGSPHRSSSMPHKQNPTSSETISGLARLLRANLQAAVENMVVWHEQDLTRSSVERVIIPDSFIVADWLLAKATALIEHLQVNAERMRQNLELGKGVIFSQAVLMKLIDKGMPRAQAHELIRDKSLAVQTSNKNLKELLAADPEIKRYLSSKELDELFDYRSHLRHVEEIFARFS
jgi:adenylosuccinate lyase